MGRSGIMTGISNYSSANRNDANNTGGPGIGNFTTGSIENTVGTALTNKFTSFQAWKKDREVEPLKENSNLPNLPMKISDSKGPIKMQMPLPRAPISGKSPISQKNTVIKLKTPIK